jgi:hypothetical protein
MVHETVSFNDKLKNAKKSKADSGGEETNDDE